jgi:hypothetical protein
MKVKTHKHTIEQQKVYHTKVNPVSKSPNLLVQKSAEIPCHLVCHRVVFRLISNK